MTTGTTRRRASIIHGYGASPTDHWFGWLAEQLEADGIPTTIPALPNSQDPEPTQWVEAVRAEVGTPDENAIVVAHSLGCLTVLRHLRSVPGAWHLGTLVLVAGFLDRLPALPELDSYIGDGCDVDGLGDRIGRLTVIRSDADPIVPPDHTDRLADLLGVSAEVVPGAGHFLASEGVTSLPEVLKAIA
ncbi:RBBP9/YdeN family alpha/beta hydrolase [Actinoallomurus rhizosphaericola]|uniref:RBBP9/YdeN family alpha/beta hydrolase n=1 Tax=Actinoallomurus rhizosphaericola TaxID=2952536 RepID=UPI00209228C7|nr:alpha/beta fold hydrolase [Actinoallomurus rhizosphaericola]MCO5996081.1 alpha/beta hydrolase [Actinoallomurus rhizosphaericola]